MLVTEVWFNQDLALNCKELRVTVGVIEHKQGLPSNIHYRVIKNNKPGERYLFKFSICSKNVEILGMKFNCVRFSRDPLKIYVGQRFFIKLNFSEPAERLNINATGLSQNNMIELCKDADVKKYFNCVSSFVVSEMP
jgi:hypothetical protein